MTRVYVGNLPMNINERDIEDLFYKYGRLTDINLKIPPRPPAFAFIAFEYEQDADDAVRDRDGYELGGERLRVELVRGRRGSGGPAGYPPHRGGDYHDSRGGPGGPPRNGGATQHTEFRVIVTGLPVSASWQDLKDHFRPAGEVVYTDVDRIGGGLVEFRSRSDMEYALKTIDRSMFRNPFHESRIRVRLPRDSRFNTRRSPSHERPLQRYSSRSRSRSRSRDRSRSRNRERPRGRRGPSNSRSPSRDRRAAAAAAEEETLDQQQGQEQQQQQQQQQHEVAPKPDEETAKATDVAVVGEEPAAEQQTEIASGDAE